MRLRTTMRRGIEAPGTGAPRSGVLRSVAATVCLFVGAVAAVGAEPQLGLPPVPVPADNPQSQAKIDLGRMLFMDRRLSPDDTMSCGMCHVPEQGFVSNELGGAVGFEGRSHRRNTPTVLNAAYFQRLFHDGREISLENQIWGPLLSFNEMANAAPGVVIEKIRAQPEYRGLFERAFDGRGPSMLTVGQAIASYERTLVSGDSRFDRWYYGKSESALDAREQRGFALFMGKGGCASCHTVNADWALFSDDAFHNTGVGYARSHPQESHGRKRTVELAPGVMVEVDEQTIASFSEPGLDDVGRYEITLDPVDRWAYRTPTLRNIALTAPYMHDGSFKTLEEVIDFYDRGGIDNPEKDPLVRPLNLQASEKADLAAFLRALTGSNAKALAAAARGR
ncbi:MAG: hypothetical protein OZ923_00765 [Comamonadaceae bacterium]|nr:hypothetical protein [Burkholderiales bacterium]MEB2347129.1 hypothetical protein [Comamonadaceae bacterium]